MKTIYMEAWELEALARNGKTCKRLTLEPQPTKDAFGMWHWKDCQWMDGGLGFPQSGIEDHSPYLPGDVVNVQNSDFRQIRIKNIRVEQLQSISESDAQTEGCQGRFSGSGEAMGSGWGITPSEEYAKRWNEAVVPLSVYAWNANPWVEAVKFELL